MAKVIKNRGISGHTCKKSGENSQVCSRKGRKTGNQPTVMQEIGKKLAGVWQNRPEKGFSADRHARNRRKTRGCVHIAVGNLVKPRGCIEKCIITVRKARWDYKKQ